MSNRRRLRATKKARRCPKCHSGRIRSMEYPDAILYICNACTFPVRELKPGHTDPPKGRTRSDIEAAGFSMYPPGRP